MKLSILKPYIFIGTLITAGTIIGITYNIIQANNKNVIEASSIDEGKTETSQNFDNANTELYDNLQKQIDKLRTDLQNTKTDLESAKTNLQDTNSELEKTKQQLAKSSANVNSLTSKLNSVNNTSNMNNTYVIDNSKTEEMSKQLENITIKDSKQNELLEEKNRLTEEQKQLNEKQEQNGKILSQKWLKAENELNEVRKELYQPNISKDRYEELKTKEERLNKEIEELRKIKNEQRPYVGLSVEEGERLIEVNDRLSEINNELLKY